MNGLRFIFKSQIRFTQLDLLRRFSLSFSSVLESFSAGFIQQLSEDASSKSRTPKFTFKLASR